MVREEMLSQMEESIPGLNITTDDEGKSFEFEFNSAIGEVFTFTTTAENDAELYHELYLKSQNFDRDDYVREVDSTSRVSDLKNLMESAEEIGSTLNTIADVARDYVRDREDLMIAVKHVKPGDTIEYTVGNQKHEAIAASAPEENHDSDEKDFEIQFEDGGAVVLDGSVAGVKPIITNHIQSSAKDFDVNEIEDGVQVLEMYVELDPLGEYAAEHQASNIKNAVLDNAYIRFYQNGDAELIASGYGDAPEKCAWICVIPQDSKEYEALCAYVQNVTGEPIQDTINRMLEPIEKAVFKLEHSETLHKLIDEGEVTGLEYAGEHCEAAYIKGNRLYMEGTNAAAVQDVKDMLDRNGFQYEECKKDRDWNRENS